MFFKIFLFLALAASRTAWTILVEGFIRSILVEFNLNLGCSLGDIV